MSKKALDLKYGDMNEITLTPILQKFFEDDSLAKVKDPYGVIDFIGDKVHCELKSRRIKHAQYPTCLIGCSKIAKFKLRENNCFIVYKYLDGLFYIKFDKDLFENFVVDLQCTWRDGICEKSNVMHIPIKYLKPLII